MTAATRASLRQRADAVERDADAARRRLAADTATLRAAFERRRATWIVSGGLASGFVLGLLPPRLWARIGAAIGGTAAIVARSVMAPMIAGAIIARRPADVEDPDG